MNDQGSLSSGSGVDVAVHLDSGFVRLLVLKGPFLITFEVVDSGVLKDPKILPWFVALSLPGTLLFVLIEAAFEHLFFKANK